MHTPNHALQAAFGHASQTLGACLCVIGFSCLYLLAQRAIDLDRLTAAGGIGIALVSARVARTA